ncbi:TIGR00289 family protein [Candidatus Micrarchaeota archaeon]|nr:TIGR00289 family protein [Candidatus Micrarchaeota archaeon]
MKVAVLFSGGKDSTFAIWLASSFGWEVKALLTILPASDSSYMFHKPNVEWTPLQAEAMDLPLIMQRSSGDKLSELDDLKSLIQSIDVDGVVTGAIGSEYQKEKVDVICEELGLKSFSPLWHKEGEILLRELVDAGFKVIITSVSAEGLDESWLGRKIDSKCIDELLELSKKHGISIVGEGGEMETFVLNAPFFKKRIKVIKSEKKWDGVRGTLEIKDAKLTFL